MTSHRFGIAVRRRGMLVVVGAGVLAVALVAVLLTQRGADPPPVPSTASPPPMGVGLLPWEPRGALAADEELVADAVGRWRAGRLAAGGTARTPAGQAYVLWAGEIGAGRLVLLQGAARDGEPLLAQVSERGDPSVLELDRVETIPPGAHVALAATYDGNLDLPQLMPGAGAGLVQLLEAPPDQSVRTLWRQTRGGTGDVLQRLESRDGAMSETFLHVGDEDEPGTAVVVAGTTAGWAGIADTVEVRPDHFFPAPARVRLADGEVWGPSGRIDGTEYLDALTAAEFVGLHSAEVREIAAGASEVDDADVAAHLLEVVGADGIEHLVLVVRERGGMVLCATPGVSAGTPPLLVAARCRDPERSVAVAATAAVGAATVEVRAGETRVGGPIDRNVTIQRYADAPAGPLDVSLVDDPAVRVQLPALP